MNCVTVVMADNVSRKMALKALSLRAVRNN